MVTTGSLLSLRSLGSPDTDTGAAAGAALPRGPSDGSRGPWLLCDAQHAPQRNKHRGRFQESCVTYKWNKVLLYVN